VAFYRVLFGQEPAKCHDDYAKFELAEPPVIFSLVPQPSVVQGTLGRIGLRLADADAVAAVKERLDAAGLATQNPCNGTLTKCYVADPDLNFWEITSGDDVDSAPPPPAPAPISLPIVEAVGPVVWEHFITAPTPERIPHADGSVDEARLTGTFNAALDDAERTALLQEVRRVLRPGGKVVVHGLVGDRPLAEQPKLPGLAALVQRVPDQTEPPQALRTAGFVGVHFVKFSEKAWFVIDGVEMREVKLIAYQRAASGSVRHVTYKGPFQQAVDDAGNVFPLGRMVAVDAAVAEVLRNNPEQFLVEEPTAAVGCCGS
jgi:SAM-dependent methyltransferase